MSKLPIYIRTQRYQLPDRIFSVGADGDSVAAAVRQGTQRSIHGRLHMYPEITLSLFADDAVLHLTIPEGYLLNNIDYTNHQNPFVHRNNFP